MSSNKILLMGRSGVGKTSMKSIIFANSAAGEAWKLSPTCEIDRSEMRFIGNMQFSLWDCSGNDEALRSYESDKGITSGLYDDVVCLIFVMDIQSLSPKTDLLHFEMILEALRSRSPDAHVYVLLHKTDLLYPSSANTLQHGALAQKVIKERKVEAEKRALPTMIHVYHTSIWDESLYKAWSSIVHAIVPNISRVEARLASIAEELRADEVVLFEPNTLLMVAQSIRHAHADNHRFEKISNIVKQFRMTCSSKKISPVKFVVRSEGKGILVVIERLRDEDAVLMVTTRHHEAPCLSSLKLKDPLD